MKNFLNDLEKKSFLVRKLWEIANSDGNLDPQELSMLESIAQSFSVDYNSALNKNSSPQFNIEEAAFCLREMYRITIIDGDLNPSEIKIIDNFCEQYKVPKELNQITKEWAKNLLDAEKTYESAYLKFHE